VVDSIREPVVSDGDLLAADIDRVCHDLADGGRIASWSYCAAALIILLEGWSGLGSLSRIWPAALAISFTTLFRFRISFKLGVWNYPLWLKVYSALTVTTALLWGSFLAILLLTDGRSSSITTTVVLMMAGFSAGGLARLAPNMKLHNGFQLSLWTPPLLAALVPRAPGPSYFLSVIFGLFLAYLWVSGRLNQTKYVVDLRRESDLDRARSAAVSASEAKSVFVANISHEIRTPLNGVLGMLALSLHQPLPASQRETLENARASAQSLLGLLNDLLDFSKIEAGRMELEHVDFNVHDVVSGVMKLFGSEAEIKGIRLAAKVPQVLAPVNGDPTRLRQILINLIGNALKFTAQGEVILEVLANSANPGELQFAVRDTGIGIPLDKQRSIFEAFSQADSATTRKYGGTGLGLAICQRLIRLMGGVLLVESKAGRGSAFRFTLTFQLAEHPPAPVVKMEEITLPKLHVLVVEDNIVNQKVTCGLLRRNGHEAEVAANGAVAVAACLARRYDLVLMDVQMPIMGGYEATRTIRAQETGERIPIVGLTANASAADRRLCLESGMDGYVSKPFTWNALAEEIAKVIKTEPREGSQQSLATL
jgi:signal transduction histidine kinase/CheY-like chemotaxis protein